MERIDEVDEPIEDTPESGSLTSLTISESSSKESSNSSSGSLCRIPRSGSLYLKDPSNGISSSSHPQLEQDNLLLNSNNPSVSNTKQSSFSLSLKKPSSV